MRPVDEDDKNKVTAVLKYFKEHMREINPKVGYNGGFSTEKFSIDDTGTKYGIVFNALPLFNKITAMVFESGLVPIEEVSIIKTRAAIVPEEYFLVDPDLYDYISYKIDYISRNIHMATEHSKFDDTKNDNDNLNDEKKKIENFEITI